MIAEFNQLIDAVEQDLSEDLDVAENLPSMWGVLLADGRRVTGIDGMGAHQLRVDPATRS